VHPRASTSTATAVPPVPNSPATLNWNPGWANFGPALGPPPGLAGGGLSDRVGAKGEYRLIGPLLLNFGADGEWTSYETNFSAREDTRIIGGYLQAGIEFGGLSGHLGLRHDDHARFGGATNVGADVSYEVAPDLRVKASLGEGFKAPSLFQLFSDFGNKALVPEKSTTTSNASVADTS